MNAISFHCCGIIIQVMDGEFRARYPTYSQSVEHIICEHLGAKALEKCLHTKESALFIAFLLIDMLNTRVPPYGLLHQLQLFLVSCELGCSKDCTHRCLRELRIFKRFIPCTQTGGGDLMYEDERYN